MPRSRPVTIVCENTAGVPLGSSFGYDAFETITSFAPAAIALLNGRERRRLHRDERVVGRLLRRAEAGEVLRGRRDAARLHGSA